MRLDHDDLVRVLDAVHQLHEGVSAEAFPALAIEVIPPLLRSDITSFNDVDPANQRAMALMDPPEHMTEAGFATLARLAAQHPLIRHYVETGDGSARRISDFMDEAEYHASPIYRELYRPMGVEHQMSITLPAMKPRIVAVTVNRLEVADDFDERDRAVLNRLRPHLAQAYRLAQERTALADALTTLSEALPLDGTHAVVLEHPPRELTPGALDVLFGAFGPPEPGEPLPRRVAHWLDTQRASVAQASPDPLGLPQPLVARRADRRTIVRRLPGSPFDTLLVTDRSTAPSTSELMLIGLTHREADVFRALMSGATNTLIASQLHVAPDTVKKHLEHIYRKLGAQTRGQAVAVALELLS